MCVCGGRTLLPYCLNVRHTTGTSSYAGASACTTVWPAATPYLVFDVQPHPYTNYMNQAYSLYQAANAIGYLLQFSAVSTAYPGQTCQTEGGYDYLTCNNGLGSQLYRNAGSSWPDTYISTTSGFQCTFTSDVSGTYWGLYWRVYAQCPAGYYFGSSSGSCLQCSAGSYMAGSNIYPAVCSSCSAGKANALCIGADDIFFSTWI
jgi:hypothetical protein